MTEKRTNWVKGLDSLRFVLALIVFLSHLENPYHEILKASPHLILRIIGMGWGVLFSGVGAVMAFFIISGFVIHYPNRDSYPATRSFLIRRWLRIGIPLLVISIVSKTVNQFAAIPIWSLYCELIYYTIYPVLIRIKISWEYKFAISFAIAFILIVFMAPGDRDSFIHQRNINYNGAYWQLGDFLTWIIGLPCWLLGVILAKNIDYYPGRVSTIGVYIFRFLVLSAGMTLDILKFHFFLSYFFSMNLFAIILFFWIKKEILYFKDRDVAKISEFSGKFSYSLYLCHNIIVFFITMLLPLNRYSYFPIILITLFFSYLFYLLVEQPSHLFSRRIAKAIEKKAIAFQ